MHEISFQEHILPLKDKLFRLALRITLNRAEAEDVVQETMIRVWSKRAEWGNLESIEAYCLTVAKRLAIDKSELKDAQNETLTSEADSLRQAPSPHDCLVKKERIVLLNQLIGRLPMKQRVVIQLRDIEGKSYKEIAALMSMTEEQVKVTLFRARQKLKQQFIDIDNYGL